MLKGKELCLTLGQKVFRLNHHINTSIFFCSVKNLLHELFGVGSIKWIEYRIIQLLKVNNLCKIYYLFRKKCLFIVWSENEYHLETILFDPDLWCEMKIILDSFFTDCILPEIVDPRAPRGLKVREPKY